jgi:hypothetical protein
MDLQNVLFNHLSMSVGEAEGWLSTVCSIVSYAYNII